jgi:hypothetical protein
VFGFDGAVGAYHRVDGACDTAIQPQAF